MKKSLACLLCLLSLSAYAEKPVRKEMTERKIEVVHVTPGENYLFRKISNVLDNNRELILYQNIYIKIEDKYYRCSGGDPGIRCRKMDEINIFNNPKK